ncbi:YkvS family protein [Bacillus cytotoxicus]|uniref:YkvS family protein n=1 Tax=unclassified Bacillus cereus group TaxID=2750818 RepID=UPI001F58495C|nr:MULTISPECIES: YkvS family protein [unclassified Bacillus cereus group]EMA6343195.1 YkvS family protein [Bacillus cytotoxicus]
MKANVGDMIQFERGNVTITGSVVKLYSESVLVEITNVSGGTFEFDRTVVNHKNYKVLNGNL